MGALVAPKPAAGHVDDEHVEGRPRLLNASVVELPDTAEQRRQVLPRQLSSNMTRFERRG